MTSLVKEYTVQYCTDQAAFDSSGEAKTRLPIIARSVVEYAVLYRLDCLLQLDG
jgi:hypothetical protein